MDAHSTKSTAFIVFVYFLCKAIALFRVKSDPDLKAYFNAMFDGKSGRRSDRWTDDRPQLVALDLKPKAVFDAARQLKKSSRTLTVCGLVITLSKQEVRALVNLASTTKITSFASGVRSSAINTCKAGYDFKAVCKLLENPDNLKTITAVDSDTLRPLESFIDKLAVGDVSMVSTAGAADFHALSASSEHEDAPSSESEEALRNFLAWTKSTISEKAEEMDDEAVESFANKIIASITSIASAHFLKRPSPPATAETLLADEDARARRVKRKKVIAVL